MIDGLEHGKFSVVVHWGEDTFFHGEQDAIPSLTKKQVERIANIYSAHRFSVSVDITTYDGYNLTVDNVYDKKIYYINNVHNMV